MRFMISYATFLEPTASIFHLGKFARDDSANLPDLPRLGQLSPLWQAVTISWTQLMTTPTITMKRRGVTAGITVSGI
jgi:hypothetical protein